MKLTKWQKITALIMLIGGVLFIGYDIFIVNKESSATISRIMLILLKFPLIIYAWFVLGAHFVSLIKTKKTYIKQLIIISSVILAFSFLTVFNVIPINNVIIIIIIIIGFITGMITWSQKRK